MPSEQAISFHVLLLVTCEWGIRIRIYKWISRNQPLLFVGGWDERTLHTSTKPPRSFTNRYNLYKSNGCFDIVGQAAIGVRRSSMKLNNLSSQPRRSGLSSMSYNLHKLSDFFDDLCTAGSVWLLKTYAIARKETNRKRNMNHVEALPSRWMRAGTEYVPD